MQEGDRRAGFSITTKSEKAETVDILYVVGMPTERIDEVVSSNFCSPRLTKVEELMDTVSYISKPRWTKEEPVLLFANTIARHCP